MLNQQYLTDPTGTPNAVVIPIAPEDFTEAIEDRAMLEATDTPLLDRDAALAYLEALPE